MTLQEIPGSVAGGTIRLARIPINGVLRVVDLTGAGDSARLAVDTFDARTRTAIADVLRDENMQRDARRRSDAAGARREALGLHQEADLRAARADQQAERKRRETEAAREKAAADAKRKREKAKSDREKTKANAAEKAKKRKDSAAEEAEGKKKDAAEAEQRGKLEQLDAKSDAIATKQAAVNAADEARRLDRAAAKAKASRKKSGSA